MIRKYFILAITFFALSIGSAMAGEVSTVGLSKTQIAELTIQAENMKTTGDVTTLDQLSSYAAFGKEFGSAIAQTANELGVVTNEFIQTPAGKLTVALIVWKIAGDDLFGIVFGILWFIIMIPLWVHFFRRMVVKPRMIETIVQDGNTKTTTKEINGRGSILEETNAWAWILGAMLILICGAGFVIMA